MTSATERADVETSSADYARRFAGPVGDWFLEVQARTTLALMPATRGARVLDVGGGHGQLVAPLLDAGCDVSVYGSDEVCAERLRPWIEQGRVSFQAGDLLNAPWADASFDVVLAFRLLPHVTRWRELIGELVRLASRAVVVDYPTLRSVNVVSQALYGWKKQVEGNTRPFTVFREGEIRSAFAAQGWRVTGRRPQFLAPMALHRALKLAPVSRLLEGAAAATGLTPLLGSPVIVRAEAKEAPPR